MTGQALTPHGPGFAFVDAVEIDREARAARARKALSPGMPFFADHFPGDPMMPGVLLIEAAAQAAGCLWGAIRGADTAREPFALARVDRFKLLSPVRPGEEIEIEVRLMRDQWGLAEFEARVTAGGRVAATGLLLLAAPADSSAVASVPLSGQ